MEISHVDLKTQIHEITGLLFTYPDKQDNRATEVWLKFRSLGFYIFINFESPISEMLITEKLVGKGNALNCSDSKRELLRGYNLISDIISILESSQGYRNNLDDTILRVKSLFLNFNSLYIISQ